MKFGCLKRKRKQDTVLSEFLTFLVTKRKTKEKKRRKLNNANNVPA